MATIKSYTDIPQSKKLKGILLPESADMCLNTSQRFRNVPTPLTTPYSKFDEFFNVSKTPEFLIPCWSLAALLNILPDRTCVYKKTYKDGRIKYKGVAKGIKELILKDNPVDACYELILKLHELKVL